MKLAREICEKEAPGIRTWHIEGYLQAEEELSREGALDVPPRMRVWQAE